MGTFGLTLDVSSTPILGWGDGVEPVEIDYQAGLTLGTMVRGHEYAIGPEGGVSYVYADKDERGHNIFAWTGGLRGDFLKETSERGVLDPFGVWRNQFWGLRLAVGYKGELYPDDSVEHGFYASFMFQYSWQNRYPSELVDNPSCASPLYYYDEHPGRCHSEDLVRIRSRNAGDIMMYESTDDGSQCTFRKDSCQVPHLYEFDPATSFIIGVGPYLAYFPNSARGEVGLSAFIGLDPFII